MTNLEAIDNINEIAIVGMAGRFPQAKNLDEYWQNLQNGVESISFFSDAELQNIDKNLLNNPNYVKATAVLEDIESFDASFFGYSPREAEIMDPQSRIFLESAWEALENAGYNTDTYQGRIGIYAGASVNTYLLFNLFANPDLLATVGLDQIKFGNHQDLLTTRAAYKLNLQGSGITIQTACSTSLVAVHLACQSLLFGECDMVLAGGVSVSVPQKAGYLYQEGGILSPDGHCRAFDAKARGTVGGSGVGIVVLKRLKDALEDGDRIHATIIGSAINNDGSLKIGYTAPSVEGQAKAIAEAQAIAGIDPETISYIEAHGTGTALGDPVEIAALTQAFSLRTNKTGFCAIGSVKTNIGHLGAAAGVAGLIKTVLALKHKLIPPSLHFEQPNPEIDFANSPFYVNSSLSEWKADRSRLAGVSSFGIGGTNAHVILKEAPTVEVSEVSRPWQLLVLSAKTESALDAATANLTLYLKQKPDRALADVAYTLQIGRRTFNHRRIAICQNLSGAVKTLETLEPQQVLTHCQEPCNPAIAFMFPGQGSQYINMGRELYQTEPIFREQVDRCSQLLKPHLNFDLRSLLYPSEAEAATAAEQLKQTYLAQPALFVIEYALAQLWMAWGVRPVAAIGHSIGEYVAACLAGVFSLEAALELVAIRGRLMQQLPAGAMVSILLPEAEVRSLLNEELSLAASNAPSSCVVSGSFSAVNALENRLAERGLDYRRLHTSHAFHSQMTDPILELFAGEIKKVKLTPPQIPFISNVTGTWIADAEATDPNYWVKHLRQTVRFSDGIAELLQESERILLEVGPGRVLSTFAKRHQVRDRPADGPEGDRTIVTSMRHPNEQQSDIAFLLKALGRLWLAGVEIDWPSFYTREQRFRIPLPTYPFERQRYWIEPHLKGGNVSDIQSKLEKKPDVADWFYLPSWKRSPLPEKGLSMASEAEQESCWLVFIDVWAIAAGVVKRLQLQGKNVITVTAGKEFAILGDRAYAINPQQRDDYDILVAEIQAQHQMPNAIAHSWHIAHFWSIAAYEQTRTEANQNIGFYSLLFLAQALEKHEISNPVDLLVVTSNIHDVTGDEELFPEQVTVLGPCKVIPQEYPNITCRTVDIVIPPTPKTAPEEKLIDQIFAESLAKSPDLCIAYRGKHRWLQTFEAVRLEGANVGKTRLREGGVYLILGGLGGIGGALAEYLAEAVRAKLILIGRSTIPDREEWEQWLIAHSDEDKISCKIRKVQALEELGAEVLVSSADIANEGEMRAQVAQAIEHFGNIHGVIHAAGIAGGGLIQRQTPEMVANSFASKIKGTQVLEAIFKESQLDFFVLCSSCRSLLGGPGRVDYCAANAFLDAVAHKNNSRNGTFTVSINWGTWREVGMSVDTLRRLNLQPETALKEGMLSTEGVDAFSRILGNSLPQVIVSPEDFHARIEYENAASTVSSFLEKVENSRRSQPTHPRPQLSNSYVAPRNQIEQTLAEIWQQLLGIEEVGIDDNFFELGGDSVLSIQLIARASKAGIQLSSKLIFERQTIAELAAVAGTNISQAEQGLVTGSLPLTPIQHWFFGQNQPDPHHWNQSVLLEVMQPLDPSLLEQTFQQLAMHHDALRLRFTRSESGWQQISGADDLVVKLTRRDLSALSEIDQKLAVEAAAAELQASLNLTAGPLVQVGLFDRGMNRPHLLLIVIHHLAVDAASWRILLEDFQTAYHQLAQGKAVQLPLKTTAFKQWAQQLKNWVESEKLQGELDYWLADRAQVLPLPVDCAGGANTVASAQTVSAVLGTAETQALLQEVPTVYRAQVQDVLLAAVVKAFARWTGVPSLLLDLEGRGREVIFEGVDLSRTVGWFTTISPVVLELRESDSPGETLKAVKEELRRIPNEGIGCGALRYLSGDSAITSKLAALPQAEVVFLYLGQFEDSLPQSSLFKLNREFKVGDRSPRGTRPHLLQISAFVTGGQMRLEWTYSENVHRRDTVLDLAEAFLEAARELIAGCQSKDVGGYTPSDFPAARISQKDFSKLLAQVTQVDRRNY
ncbi:SDR family oxidoreductase [Microcoleus sp. F4-D5]|uniref:SDR family oxidoreductase n=1 Tax=Microcoleus sp. F4-D5 TaxID=2818760 RepID=UPI002FD56F5E